MLYEFTEMHYYFSTYPFAEWMDVLTKQYLAFLLAGVADTPFVTLPKGKGVKLSILEEREMILKKRKAAAAN